MPVLGYTKTLGVDPSCMMYRSQLDEICLFMHTSVHSNSEVRSLVRSEIARQVGFVGVNGASSAEPDHGGRWHKFLEQQRHQRAADSEEDS